MNSSKRTQRHYIKQSDRIALSGLTTAVYR